MKRNTDRKETESKNEYGEVRKTKRENIMYGERRKEQKAKSKITI